MKLIQLKFKLFNLLFPGYALELKVAKREVLSLQFVLKMAKEHIQTKRKLVTHLEDEAINPDLH